VQASLAVPAGVVASQINAVLSDLEPAAIKIGMIPDKEVAEAIVDELKPYLQQHTVPVVYDPVMVSTSGYCLMHPDAIQYVTTHLFPLCTLITPNLPEAEQLGDTLAPYAYLLKGGHAEGDVMTDVLHLPDGTKIAFSSERITTRNLHGTGCTLSSAIASRLALGCDIPDAVSLAKTFVTAAIRRSVDINIGGGNGPILVD
jgi:hydroxymethylpyrimidine/phosphomethylpyrimidine kinase